MVKRVVHLAYKTARRIAIAVVGGSVVAVGIVMIVAPGPAFVVIPLGLGILALEFAFARRWLERMRSTTETAIGRVRGVRHGGAIGDAGSRGAGSPRLEKTE